MDRNWDVFFCHEIQAVALRKESVDRNIIYLLTASALLMSLSARRAWIEMSGHRQAHTSPTRSLSARRAWIEIRSQKPNFFA